MIKNIIFFAIVAVVIAAAIAAWYFFIYKPGQAAAAGTGGTGGTGTPPVDGTPCQTTDNQPGLFANGICIPQQVFGFGYAPGDRVVAIRDGVQIYNTYGDPISDNIKNRYEFLGCVNIIDQTWVKFNPQCGRGGMNDQTHFLVKKEDVIKMQQ